MLALRPLVPGAGPSPHAGEVAREVERENGGRGSGQFLGRSAPEAMQEENAPLIVDPDAGILTEHSLAGHGWP